MKKASSVLLFLGVLVGLTSQAQVLKPGIWKAKASFKVNGLPLPSSDEEDCVLPHEVKDVKASITKNLKKNGCVLTKWDVKNKNIDAALSCDSDDLVATGTIKGSYTVSSYKLDGEAKGTYKKMLPASAVIELRGEWLKACEPEVKK